MRPILVSSLLTSNFPNSSLTRTLVDRCSSKSVKPVLARGKLRCLGATTLAEYRKYIEKVTPCLIFVVLRIDVLMCY